MQMYYQLAALTLGKEISKGCELGAEIPSYTHGKYYLAFSRTINRNLQEIEFIKFQY